MNFRLARQNLKRRSRSNRPNKGLDPTGAGAMDAMVDRRRVRPVVGPTKPRDSSSNAMLLERCEPGTALRRLPAFEQDVVIARLLRRLWRSPTAPHSFRPLAAMTVYWAGETRAVASQWPDAALIEDGLRLFDELSQPSFDDALLATDLHVGNVLSAQGEPWLMIDPKPFVGDCSYDATQHLFNCKDLPLSDPKSTIRRFADLLELDDERVRLWMFARAAAEPRKVWNDDSLSLARALA
jgi:streptomycin 6-kinase